MLLLTQKGWQKVCRSALPYSRVTWKPCSRVNHIHQVTQTHVKIKSNGAFRCLPVLLKSFYLRYTNRILKFSSFDKQKQEKSLTEMFMDRAVGTLYPYNSKMLGLCAGCDEQIRRGVELRGLGDP